MRQPHAPQVLEVFPQRLTAAVITSAGAPIQTVFACLAQDELRTDMIAAAICEQYRQRRKVLVLTERTDHLESLQEALGDLVQPLFVLHGRLANKARVAQLAALDALAADTPRVVLATGRLVGEGFDHPALDTLVLAMPVAWKGTLQQYAGRLHLSPRIRPAFACSTTWTVATRHCCACGRSASADIEQWATRCVCPKRRANWNSPEID